MSPELINTIGTIVGVLVAALGAFLFAFWIAMGIWTFNDIRSRTRDWLVITLAVALVLIFPLIGLILYMMIRPKATLAEVYDRALEEEALLRELEETMTCHQCGVPVSEAWVYCPNCHGQLQHSCPSCGKLVRNEWEICVFCGGPQPRAAARPQLSTVQAAPSLQPVMPAAQPGSTSLRNPFRRETPPAPPSAAPFSDEVDDAYRPARMPE
ncbi:MAG: zinc ribbon domain-containing protein [Caldilinea sp.]|uniref:double zinc ribbon domain-containing protein n=1 Tax=Caldilinea sp. TaxID=2293560 RepID=UPI002C66FFE3|nr:zinc ribbon domain-containing protein [Caldilinea sp.]HRA66695.1 zinc ribbon domain-containing protein [Caldilinea sp.]